MVFFSAVNDQYPHLDVNFFRGRGEVFVSQLCIEAQSPVSLRLSLACERRQCSSNGPDEALLTYIPVEQTHGKPIHSNW